MINKASILRTNTIDPWWNLAVEEYLLDRVQEGQCILYLWQNHNTVVIGKNQNPWRECRTELLEKEEGKLARRLSGGGAVFHDIGNLNFTFLMERENYDLEKQVRVILTAAQKMGINAEMTGRNDITVDGRKFSGNAFCFRKNNAYHHGTILVSVDMEKLGRYLQVSKEKIQSKGIESVRSRVVNLSEFKTDLTIDQMVDAFIEAFGEVYSCKPEMLKSEEVFDKAVLDELYKKYSSWEWRYGEAPKFDLELTTRFPWGGIEIGMRLESGRVADVMVYSDAMDENFIETLPKALKGSIFSSAELAGSLRKLQVDTENRSKLEDIAKWLESKGF